MTILDANLLVYAFRADLLEHKAARDWLAKQDEVGVPTPSELAFLRLTTKPLGPLKAAPWSKAYAFIQALLNSGQANRVHPDAHHPELLNKLATQLRLSGDQLVDAWLAALALERDATLASADRGFARFPGLKWVNPLKAP